jgi:hypothetical protein
MTTLFGDFDATDFWEDCEYAAETYVDDSLNERLTGEIESILGYKIPSAYIELCNTQNGGSPNNTCYRTQTPIFWSDDHAELVGIFAIGKTADRSLGGIDGSRFWIEEWRYPDIGIYFADTPTAGHDMFCLDYQTCGPNGEPKVVHIHQEDDYKTTLIADSFEAFIRGLEPKSNFAVG